MNNYNFLIKLKSIVMSSDGFTKVLHHNEESKFNSRS